MNINLAKSRCGSTCAWQQRSVAYIKKQWGGGTQGPSQSLGFSSSSSSSSSSLAPLTSLLSPEGACPRTKLRGEAGKSLIETTMEQAISEVPDADAKAIWKKAPEILIASVKAADVPDGGVKAV